MSNPSSRLPFGMNAWVNPGSARGIAAGLTLVPWALHVIIIVVFGWDSNSPGFVLCAAILAAGATGFYLGGAGFDPVSVALAAAAPPAVFAWGRVYWTLDMHSPASPAQALVGLIGWRDAPAPFALGLIAAISALLGWAKARFDYRRSRLAD